MMDEVRTALALPVECPGCGKASPMIAYLLVGSKDSRLRLCQACRSDVLRPSVPVLLPSAVCPDCGKDRPASMYLLWQVYQDEYGRNRVDFEKIPGVAETCRTCRKEETQEASRLRAAARRRESAKDRRARRSSGAGPGPRLKIESAAMVAWMKTLDHGVMPAEVADHFACSVEVARRVCRTGVVQGAFSRVPVDPERPERGFRFSLTDRFRTPVLSGDRPTAQKNALRKALAWETGPVPLSEVIRKLGGGLPDVVLAVARVNPDAFEIAEPGPEGGEVRIGLRTP